MSSRIAAVARPLILALALGTVPAVVTSSAQAAPYCGITWGSLAKSAGSTVTTPITNLRAGRHACYDRLIIDLPGRSPGYTVHYVSDVYAQGSGRVVPVRGGAKLAVAVEAPASTTAGAPTYRPSHPAELVDVTGWSTFRQVAWAGSFEGSSSVGLGVRARLPFRAFSFTGSDGVSHLVVDVAHAW